MKKLIISKEVLDKLYNSQNMNAYQISKKLKCGSTTIYRKLDEHKIKRRDNSACHLRYKKRPFSGDTREMAYLIGFRLGDLHVRKAVDSPGCKTIRVEAHTTKQAQIELVNSLFGGYSHVHYRGISNKTLRALCFLDESFSFLLVKKDRIEPWILSNKGLFLAFLAGYVDAEGHIGIHTKTNGKFLIIQTQDKVIIQSIQKNLVKFGFYCLPSKISVKKGYTSPSYPNKPMNKDVWSVSIYMPDLQKLLNDLFPLLKHGKRKSDALKVLNAVENHDRKYD